MAALTLAACGDQSGARTDAAESDEQDTVIYQNGAEVARGELLHIYDMSRSPTPDKEVCSQLYYAVFDPERFSSAALSDQSITLVCVDPKDETLRIENAPADPSKPRFSAFRTTQGLNWQNLPLDGVWFVSEGHSGDHLKEGGAGDFAWDFVVLADEASGVDPEEEMHCQGAWGSCSSITTECSDGASNHDYYAWSRCVRAPTSGTLLDAHDDAPDICPYAKTDEPNYVDIGFAGGYFVRLTHLQNASIAVSQDQEVATGASIGLVGNSGYTFWPHLHMTLNWQGYAAPFNGLNGGAWSVPSTFESLYVKNAGEVATAPAELVNAFVPTTGQFVSNQPFTTAMNDPQRRCE